jgi:hypothetical protein
MRITRRQLRRLIKETIGLDESSVKQGSRAMAEDMKDDLVWRIESINNKAQYIENWVEQNIIEPYYDSSEFYPNDQEEVKMLLKQMLLKQDNDADNDGTTDADELMKIAQNLKSN